MLDRLARHAPVMKTVSLPRARHRLHAMPTSTGYEIRADSSYAWDGRARGQTPFTVLQHTVAGAGNLIANNGNDGVVIYAGGHSESGATIGDSVP